jgi:hypothetical protein
VAGPQKFFDPSQPQTLQIATFLLYLDAALLVLRGAAFASGLGLMLAAGSVGGAYGMANNRKWGYGLSVGVALFGLVYPFLLGVTLSNMVRFATVELLLAVALVALLVHPQSREYQRIWFS